MPIEPTSEIMRPKVGVEAHRIAKASAALKGVPLKEWLEEAIREKSARENQAQTAQKPEELCLA